MKAFTWQMAFLILSNTEALPLCARVSTIPSHKTCEVHIHLRLLVVTLAENYSKISKRFRLFNIMHRGPSQSGSDSNSSEGQDDIEVKGKRVHMKVDYVAMNSEMFGEEGEDDSDQDYG